MPATERKSFSTSFSTSLNRSNESAKRVKINSSSNWISPVVPAERPTCIVTLSEDDFDNRFLEPEFLAKGGFGTITRAFDNQTESSVVIKSFLRHRVCNWTDGIPTEIHIMMSMNHQNSAPMLEAFESNLNFRMTMPDTNGEDLVQYIPENIADLIPSFPYIAREVAKGLYYLHEGCLIVHLDIKLKNVIISKIGDDFKVQIIDFGCAKRYSKGVKEFVVDGGTHLYSCKERYTKAKIMGPEADVFSFGVFLYSLCFNFKKPFQTISDIELNEEVSYQKL